jgi:hypothetical protein
MKEAAPPSRTGDGGAAFVRGGGTGWRLWVGRERTQRGFRGGWWGNGWRPPTGVGRGPLVPADELPGRTAPYPGVAGPSRELPCPVVALHGRRPAPPAHATATRVTEHRRLHDVVVRARRAVDGPAHGLLDPLPKHVHADSRRGRRTGRWLNPEQFPLEDSDPPVVRARAAVRRSQWPYELPALVADQRPSWRAHDPAVREAPGTPRTPGWLPPQRPPHGASPAGLVIHGSSRSISTSARSARVRRTSIGATSRTAATWSSVSAG